MLNSSASRKGYDCKICDFGMARTLEADQSHIITSQLGTVTHMPPELFQLDKSTKLSKKVDIYAVGMLIYHVVNGETPFVGLQPAQVVVQVAMGRKLKLPDTVPRDISSMYEKCVASEP